MAGTDTSGELLERMAAEEVIEVASRWARVLAQEAEDAGRYMGWMEKFAIQLGSFALRLESEMVCGSGEISGYGRDWREGLRADLEAGLEDWLR
jgi:hypothetical protein